MPRGTPRLRTPENKVNQIGGRVKQRRKALKLKQDELCAQLATHTDGAWRPAWQDISRIENGARMVSDLEVIALSRMLACTACWLLTGEPPITPISEKSST